MLRYKVFEPILLLGRERFANMDIRIRVKGGGYTSQIYGEPSPPARLRDRDLQGGRRRRQGAAAAARSRQALSDALAASRSRDTLAVHQR